MCAAWYSVGGDFGVSSYLLSIMEAFERVKASLPNLPVSHLFRGKAYVRDFHLPSDYSYKLEIAPSQKWVVDHQVM